jgi:hypothetical protein
MKIQKTVSISLLLFALLLGLAACGGSTSTSSSSADSLPATDVMPTPPPDIIVILADSKITSTVKTFKPGVPYRFLVWNQGKKDHEFVILSTALGVASLTGTQLKQAALVYVADVAPNKSKIVDFMFPASAVGQSYQMASYLPNNYQAGLKLPITITH